MKNNNPELLAPAGDIKSLTAAVNNGADAVYLGLQNFNARIKAGNFDNDNLREIVKYCHTFGVKIYVTVNILIKSEEMAEVLDEVEKALKCGVDAFIVQDLGLVSMLTKAFPGIILHASTQMGIHSLQGALVAEKLGIKRVILSREVKLEDIKQIKQNTNLEIECFVHGALCVAFSGNCYLSSLEFDKSGNRGQCSQLCRLKYYNNKTDKKGYLLSAKDLCLATEIKTLTDIGVDSFKIEGRLRRAGYVAKAVSIYRSIIDKNGKVSSKNIVELQKIFNRGDGLPSGYLRDKPKVIYTNSQNHMGVCIGSVVKTENFKTLHKITLKLNQDIHSGDGLKFFNNGAECASCGVGNVNNLSNGYYEIFSNANVCKDDQVNLILDYEMEKAVLDNKKIIKIDFNFVAKIGEPCELEFMANNIKISKKSTFICEEARNQPITKSDVLTQISKLNETIFEINDSCINIENVFIAKSQLNEMRRDVIAMLEQAILNDFEKDNTHMSCKREIVDTVVVPVWFDSEISKVIYVNENSIINDIPSEVYTCLSPNNFCLKTVSEFYKSYAKTNDKPLLIDMPIIANYNDYKIIDEVLSSFEPNQIILVANNYYALNYLESFKVVAGIGLNVYNCFTAQKLKELGVENIIHSIENVKEKTISNDGISYSYGKKQVMTFSHCPFQTISENSCNKCTYNDKLTYTCENNNKYVITRQRISECYFTMYQDKIYKGKKLSLIDTRNLSAEESKNILGLLKNNNL